MSSDPVTDRLPWDRCFQFAIAVYAAAIAAFSGAPRFQGGEALITWASTLLYAVSAFFFVVAVWLTYLAVKRHPANQRWSRRTGSLVIAIVFGFFVLAAVMSLTATWAPGLAPLTRGWLWGAASTLIFVGILLGCTGWFYLRRVLPMAAPVPREATAVSKDEEQRSTSPTDEAKHQPVNMFAGTWRPYLPTWEDQGYREGEQQKLALRNTRGLKPLSEFQDGLSADRIDPDSWGYLRSGLHSDPGRITLDRETHSPESDFEIHRLAGGAVELVGFVSLQDAHAARTSAAECSVSIFTRKTATATELITIPVQRIISGTSSRVRNTAYRQDLRLKPAK